jgi:ATP-dependent Lon protease
VGGIKEKVLGAHRAKMRKVILPAANRQDAEQDIPPEIRKEIELVYVRNLEEALREAFGSQLDWRTGQVESRL